jgi:DNA-binding GntR family transcriptional regulator
MPPVGTKADDIALALEEAIVAGEIAPGTVLRQEQLSERYHVSRTPVREALRRLAALGLVQFVPNRGVRVRTLTAEELAALDKAEQRFSELTLELRRRAREGTQDGALVASWVHANHAFHDVIYAAADAPFVERLAKSARRSFFTHVVWAAGLDIDHLYEQNDLQHRAIREAIAAGSAEGARLLAREHVLSSGRMLETILEQVRERQAAELRSA